MATIVPDSSETIVGTVPIITVKITIVVFEGCMTSAATWAVAEPWFAQRTHHHVIYKSSARPELFERLSKPLYEAYKHGACHCFASAFQHFFRDSESLIPVVNQPVLILWASCDRSHRTSNRVGLAAYAPDAICQEIPDTGHHLELENPKAVTGAIRRFLRL